MPSRWLKQSNFTGGVLDEDLRQRRELKDFHRGLGAGGNVIPLPKGGFIGRGGLEHVAFVHKTLEVVDPAGGVFFGVNGGDANKLPAGATPPFATTTPVGTTSPYEVVVMAFDEIVSIVAVDLIDFRLSEGVAVDGLVVQYNDGDDWQDFDRPVDMSSTLRARRFARPAGEPVSASTWRVVRIDTAALGTATIELRQMIFWREREEESAVRLSPFTFSTTEKYVMAMSDRHGVVYRGGARTSAFSLPHRTNQLARMGRAQELDTQVLFHTRVPPWRLMRQGGHDEWDSRAAVFSNIPNFDFDGTGRGGADDVQELAFDGFEAGDEFFLKVGEETTAAIAYDGDMTVLAPLVEAAIVALAGVDVTGFEVAVGSGLRLVLTFGGNNGGRDWPPVAGWAAGEPPPYDPGSAGSGGLDWKFSDDEFGSGDWQTP